MSFKKYFCAATCAASIGLAGFGAYDFWSSIQEKDLKETSAVREFNSLSWDIKYKFDRVIENPETAIEYKSKLDKIKTLVEDTKTGQEIREWKEADSETTFKGLWIFGIPVAFLFSFRQGLLYTLEDD